MMKYYILKLAFFCDFFKSQNKKKKKHMMQKKSLKLMLIYLVLLAYAQETNSQGKLEKLHSVSN